MPLLEPLLWPLLLPEAPLELEPLVDGVVGVLLGVLLEPDAPLVEDDGVCELVLPLAPPEVPCAEK